MNAILTSCSGTCSSDQESLDDAPNADCATCADGHTDGGHSVPMDALAHRVNWPLRTRTP